MIGRLAIVGLLVALLRLTAAQAGTDLPLLSAREPISLPHYSGDKSLGVVSCASSLCHGSIEPWKDSNVLQNEYVTWSRSDKHARAFNVLNNQRSKEIANKLGMTEAPGKANLCLDCHTHNPLATRREAGFLLSDGVACESCHGPAERWIGKHLEADTSHEKNIAHGMYPVDNEVARAKLCLSCHLGNEQKFVSHRMMAAGHPRMSFELDTFTHLGPAHFRIDEDWRKRKGTWDGARAWAIGQAVAAQELLGLLLSPQRGRDGMFPELVLFDCHSCHHPMSDKRNNVTRLGAGPGVMRLNDSGLLMLAQIAKQVDSDNGAAFGHAVARLHSAVANGKRADGDIDPVGQARVVRDLIDPLIRRIKAQGFSNAQLQQTLLGLIDEGLAGQFRDYLGAEQSVMALQSLIDVMERQGLLRAPATRPAIRRLLAAVVNDEKYQPADFTAALTDLKRAVQAGTRNE